MDRARMGERKGQQTETETERHDSVWLAFHGGAVLWLERAANNAMGCDAM